MSNAVFPDLVTEMALPREPIYDTNILPSPGGGETRSSWGAVRYRYTLDVTLRQYGAFTEAATLLAFFDQHRGAWDSFLFNDPFDGTQRRVRFEQDRLPLTRFATGVWTATFSLISVI